MGFLAFLNNVLKPYIFVTEENTYRSEKWMHNSSRISVFSPQKSRKISSCPLKTLSLERFKF